MSTGLKVVLWIVGILGAFIAILIGIGVYVGLQAKGAMEDGIEFAATVDKGGCLEEMARQSAECNGVSCVVSGSLFAMACLQQAEGTPEDVCDTDESAFEQAQAYCSEAGENEYCTDVMASIVEQYCADPDANLTGF